MAEVQVIPPKAARPDTLRVAAYCRVSSDSADQLHADAAQIRAYTQAINAHDGWDLVDIYADEGLTGTRMDKREDFNRLMADCRKGKIDKIVVKSISRFARNTRWPGKSVRRRPVSADEWEEKPACKQAGPASSGEESRPDRFS